MRAGLLVVLAACWVSSPVTPPPPVVPPPPQTTLQLLTSLETLLEHDVTVDDVARAVGPIDDDPGPESRSELTLHPMNPKLATAKLARYPADEAKLAGAVYLLELAIPPRARPTFGELATVFGPGRIGPSLHAERIQMFYPHSRSKRWSVAVIAAMSSCHDPHSDAEPPPGPCTPIEDASRVETITFRRDPGF